MSPDSTLTSYELLDQIGNAFRHDSPQVTSHEGLQYNKQVLGILETAKYSLILLSQIQNSFRVNSPEKYTTG